MIMSNFVVVLSIGKKIVLCQNTVEDWGPKTQKLELHSMRKNIQGNNLNLNVS